MASLVEFELHIPEGTPESEVAERVDAEARASAQLGRDGSLVRLWRPPVAAGERKQLGSTTVTPLSTHPNDPKTQSLRSVPQ
ncbi:MAG: hypothetical protein JO325_13520 [Solirubrobacterales bacterium]|nr:hypothetical protein [Solirubrobacterales bacterium]